MINQSVNFIDAIILTQPAFKFDNHERVLAFMFDRLTDPRVATKVEDIFFRYLDQRKPEYNSLVSFLVSKNSNFNVQTQNSHKLLQKKLQILLKMTQEMDQFEQGSVQLATPIHKSSKFQQNGQPPQNYPYSEVYNKLLKTIDHPTTEIRTVTQKIIMEIYQKKGFDKVTEFVQKLPVKVL